jgi:hypothetical protein
MAFKLLPHPKTAVPARTIRLNSWNAKTFRTQRRDIVFAPPPCRTLADMDPEEIKELERRYGAKVR